MFKPKPNQFIDWHRKRKKENLQSFFLVRSPKKAETKNDRRKMKCQKYSRNESILKCNKEKSTRESKQFGNFFVRRTFLFLSWLVESESGFCSLNRR